MTMGKTLPDAIRRFRKIIAPYPYLDDLVSVVARPLTAEEAIGTPEHDDYPLLKGKERMMEARFRGAAGQAYTDQIGNFEGTLGDVLTLPMDSNYHRAVLVATVNAVLRHQGVIDKSCHCKDEDPVRCAPYLPKALALFSSRRVGMIGHQPRLLEIVSQNFQVRICDRDPDQISKEKSGVIIEPPENYGDILDWCDLILATGTTLVNDTIDYFFVSGKPTVFYGITISGVAKMLNLKHFCPLGR
jgi:hypothetical protein